MDTSTEVQGRRFTEPSPESLQAVSVMKPRLEDADALRRSEENILRWMTYLPEDCIGRMIEMEWDITT